tara:strand:- start:1781 stop:2515 length:735 start_codon:yes stop_codon:yes gene_type:complete
MSLKSSYFVIIAAVGLALPTSSFSQARATSSKDPGKWALLYSEVLDSNRKALGVYSWQYRVEVMEDNELLYVDLLEAGYDRLGNLQTTRVGQELKIKERHGPLSRAGQEGRLREIEEKIEFLKEVIRSYVYMSRGEVVDFFDKAETTEAVGYNNALRVDGENVLNEGDSITLFGDLGTAQPIFLTFSVPFDDKVRVDCSIQFRHLRGNGAFYGAEVTANFVELKKIGKSKALSIEVESFDFIKL